MEEADRLIAVVKTQKMMAMMMCQQILAGLLVANVERTICGSLQIGVNFEQGGAR